MGSENFADYRTQLLPWSECLPRLAAYCGAISVPDNGADFVAQLKAELENVAIEVDVGFPDNTEPLIKSGDPVEQEKQLKYASLVANTIMLSNVVDLTGTLPH